MSAVFLRHGEIEPMKESDGDPNPDLSPKGRAHVTEAVKGLPKVSAILTDTKARTKQTADIWSKSLGGVPVIEEPNLDNWDLGPQHRGKHSAAANHVVARLLQHPDSTPPGGGESANAYRARLFGAVAPAIASDQVIGIANHSRGLRMVETEMDHGKVTPTTWHEKDLPPHASAILVTPEKAERV